MRSLPAQDKSLKGATVAHFLSHVSWVITTAKIPAHLSYVRVSSQSHLGPPGRQLAWAPVWISNPCPEPSASWGPSILPNSCYEDRAVHPQLQMSSGGPQPNVLQLDAEMRPHPHSKCSRGRTRLCPQALPFSLQLACPLGSLPAPPAYSPVAAPRLPMLVSQV